MVILKVSVAALPAFKHPALVDTLMLAVSAGISAKVMLWVVLQPYLSVNVTE